MQNTDWSLQPLAKECQLTGQVFKTGQKVLSCLFLDESGMLQRCDYLEGEYEKAHAQGTVLGRWSQIIKDKPSEKINKAESNRNVEQLFLSFYEDDSEHSSNQIEGSRERALLKYLFAIALERKRILRSTESTSSGTEQSYLHVKSKKQYVVPLPIVDQDTQETLLKIQEQLTLLL